MEKYKQKNYNQFTKDLENAGYEVSDYNGRYFYHGPAVSCEKNEFQNIVRKTSVRLQWDQLGLGIIVYPV